MGAAENAAAIRRGYEAFNTADMATLTEVFDGKASWHTPGKGPLAGDKKGRDATFAYFGELGGQTAGSFKAELQYLLTDDDDHVVGVHHNTGERNGKKLDVNCCLLFKLKDGKIMDGQEHFDDLNAWDAFWS
ncbi:MAG: nuclear transport factor 2 family protein [Acidimicrobiia bacterium]|nr:nuclear transport factor 2 family protein [Acidimicrobiia bacterium]